jgi:malate dehydrogenase (oxaloacetate-decarboxylating)(NADP+)
MTAEDARKQFWLVDSQGLVTKNRGDKLAAHKVPYARSDNGDVQLKSLLEVVKHVKPTVRYHPS